MPNEISATALLQSDFGRIDEEVDRIAMAYCEAQLITWARQPADYEKKRKALRDSLLQEAQAPLLHLLYWFDVRADHWSRNPPPPYRPDGDEVAELLKHFAQDAERLQRLAWRAGLHEDGRQGDDAPSKKTEGVLKAFLSVLGSHNHP
jgi:hypothetical protein